MFIRLLGAGILMVSLYAEAQSPIVNTGSSLPINPAESAAIVLPTGAVPTTPVSSAQGLPPTPTVTSPPSGGVPAASATQKPPVNYGSRPRANGGGKTNASAITPPTVAPSLFQGSERLMNPAFSETIHGEEDRLFKNIDYPELQVVPRASERLAYEALAEKDQKLSFFWTLQIPAVASMVAGLVTYQKYTSDTMSDQSKRDHDALSIATFGTGLLWLGVDFYLMAGEPYNEALVRVNKIKKGDRKNDLLRERISEETMEKTAKTMRTLNTLSILTNSILILSTLPGTKDELRPLMLFPFALAFTPYVFPQKYVDIFEKHQEYKRKIYAPVSFFDFRWNKKTGGLEPITGLVWNF